MTSTNTTIAPPAAPAAAGFCGCLDHHPHRAEDRWCYLCDRPLLPVGMRLDIQRIGYATGLGWPR